MLPLFCTRSYSLFHFILVFSGQNFQSSMVICLLRSVTDVKQSTLEGMQLQQLD